MGEELEKCPFCKSDVELQKIPLWDMFCRRSGGLFGKFRYKIVCSVCGCTNNHCDNTTVNMSDEEARRLTVEGWNNRG